MTSECKRKRKNLFVRKNLFRTDAIEAGGLRTVGVNRQKDRQRPLRPQQDVRPHVPGGVGERIRPFDCIFGTSRATERKAEPFVSRRTIRHAEVRYLRLCAGRRHDDKVIAPRVADGKAA